MNHGVDGIMMCLVVHGRHDTRANQVNMLRASESKLDMLLS